MTDTTDIRALCEQSDHGPYALVMKQNEALTKGIISLQTQLEAERQRADALQTERDEFRRRLKLERSILEDSDKELAELKGEQVPVAYTAARWLDTRCKLSVWTDRESAVMEIGDNSKVAELYDHPQKPIVLPKSHYVCGCADRFMSAPEVIAAIEAAGGIVKDGA